MRKVLTLLALALGLCITPLSIAATSSAPAAKSVKAKKPKKASAVASAPVAEAPVVTRTAAELAEIQTLIQFDATQDFGKVTPTIASWTASAKVKDKETLSELYTFLYTVTGYLVANYFNSPNDLIDDPVIRRDRTRKLAMRTLAKLVNDKTAKELLALGDLPPTEIKKQVFLAVHNSVTPDLTEGIKDGHPL